MSFLNRSELEQILDEELASNCNQWQDKQEEKLQQRLALASTFRTTI